MTARAVTSSRRPVLMALAVPLVALAASGAFAGVVVPLEYLLPPLLLVLALVTRRYPGERALLALITGDRHERRRKEAGFLVGRARPRAVVPRGGCLLASSLAVRPPPAPRTAPS